MTKPEKKSQGGVVPNDFRPGDRVRRKGTAARNETYAVGSQPFTVRSRTGRWVQDEHGQDHLTENLEYAVEAVSGEYVLSPGQVQSIGGKEAIQKLSDLARGGEVRMTSETGGQKGVKPRTFHLLPWKAVGVVAEHFGIGAAKYEDHNWRRGYKWSYSFSAAQRHLDDWWEGEDKDEDGLWNLAAVGFHVLVLITFAIVSPKRYGRFDDRYKEPDVEE